ncbi:MAG TPA: N-acyl homoserine lactonase family protein [Ktedonobacterales bacterium]|nr:N-acyl homoserine lactonase family protein [Ktedonobacterales bacterium]
MRLYFLHCGSLDLERSVIIPGAPKGQRLTLPIPAMLLQVDGKNILVDTGLPDFCVDNPRALADEGEPDPPEMVPYMSQQQTVAGQLALLGLTLGNLDLVVNSHLHFDHCGGNQHMTASPILVDARELETARAGIGVGPVFEGPGVTFQTFEGDYELAPGVQLLATPGHTPGHHSLLVRLPHSGPLLLTVDAVYTEALWRENALGACANAEDARRSMDRLRQVAQEAGAQVVFGHDPEQWRTLRHAPAFYE